MDSTGAGQMHAPQGQDQSRESGSGSEAMALCKSRFTHPVRVTPIGFLRSTSASTLGSTRTTLATIGSGCGTFWA